MKKLPKLKIFFIGNSFTYYNDLPKLLTYFIRISHAGTAKTKILAKSSENLKMHWKNGWALETIRNHKWTHVVLQEQSMLGKSKFKNGKPDISNPKTFQSYARRFNSEIKKTRAQTVFFLTWVLDNFPETQKIITKAYTKISKELNATLVPVGLVWRLVRKEKPKLNLYSPDGKHPGPLGTYLITCLFYAILLKKSPVGLPHISFNSKSSKKYKKVDIIKLSSKDALFLQKTAWKATKTTLNKL